MMSTVGIHTTDVHISSEKSHSVHLDRGRLFRPHIVNTSRASPETFREKIQSWEDQVGKEGKILK